MEKTYPQSAKGSGDYESRVERLEALLEGGSRTTSSAFGLESRITALERKLLDQGNGKETHAPSPVRNYCALPPVPPRIFGPEVSADRARLIQLIAKKWVNGTKLRYFLMDGDVSTGGEEQKNMVREGFEVWRRLGIGIRFEEVRDMGSAEVRIGFVEGDGAWSYVGRDIIDIPGKTERTMNFGWDLRRDPRGVDVAVHEIGHTLGFPHEHQNPFSGLVWDEEAVYRYFGGPPNNWSRETTDWNILRKLSRNEVEGTQWDPNSIMHYAFAPGLILQPEDYKNGLEPHGGLSPRDIAQVKVFYPALNDATNPELKPFRSQSLTLAPAQQANFAVKPTVTRDYRMQTFGGSDTVMVLFEDHGGDLKYVKGDDDSGTDRNALINARLVAGRDYVLRLRMYSSFDTGEIAVMLW